MRLCVEPIKGLAAVNCRRPLICERASQPIATIKAKHPCSTLMAASLKRRCTTTWTAQGTEDFLGLEKARGRTLFPSGAASTALIQKGDWCGSEKDLSLSD